MEALHDQRVDRLVVAILGELAIIENCLARVMERCLLKDSETKIALEIPIRPKRILH